MPAFPGSPGLVLTENVPTADASRGWEGGAGLSREGQPGRLPAQGTALAEVSRGRFLFLQNERVVNVAAISVVSSGIVGIGGLVVALPAASRVRMSCRQRR
jgi:hypothetical protein